MQIYELWLIIFKNQTILSQTNLVQSSQRFWDNLIVTDLFDIDDNSKKILSDEILKLNFFESVAKLHASNNSKITNVSFMKNLKIISASGSCGIDQNGIAGLDLVELHAVGNQYINQSNS